MDPAATGDFAGNVLCLALDPPGTRCAVPLAVAKAEEQCGSLLTLVAFEPLTGWQALQVALGPYGFDPASTACAEATRLHGTYAHRSRCVAVEGRDRTLDLAASILADGCWPNLLIGEGHEVFGDLEDVPRRARESKVSVCRRRPRAT